MSKQRKPWPYCVPGGKCYFLARGYGASRHTAFKAAVKYILDHVKSVLTRCMKRK